MELLRPGREEVRVCLAQFGPEQGTSDLVTEGRISQAKTECSRLAATFQ